MGTTSKIKKGLKVQYLVTGESGKVNYYNPHTGDIDIKIGKMLISTHISECRSI